MKVIEETEITGGNEKAGVKCAGEKCAIGRTGFQQCVSEELVSTVLPHLLHGGLGQFFRPLPPLCPASFPVSPSPSHCHCTDCMKM